MLLFAILESKEPMGTHEIPWVQLRCCSSVSEMSTKAKRKTNDIVHGESVHVDEVAATFRRRKMIQEQLDDLNKK